MKYEWHVLCGLPCTVFFFYCLTCIMLCYAMTYIILHCTHSERFMLSYGSCCDSHILWCIIPLHDMSCVTVMLVHDMLFIAAYWMSWSYLSRTCCTWSHACSKPIWHAFILDRFLIITYCVNTVVYDHSPKSCLHTWGLKCLKTIGGYD